MSQEATRMQRISCTVNGDHIQAVKNGTNDQSASPDEILTAIVTPFIEQFESSERPFIWSLSVTDTAKEKTVRVKIHLSEENFRMLDAISAKLQRGRATVIKSVLYDAALQHSLFS